MATSGVTSFNMSLTDLVQAALRICQSYGLQDTIPAAEITNTTQALNVVLKKLSMQGLYLWAVQELTFTLTSGQYVYQLGAATGASSPIRPLRITDAYLRNLTTMTDVSLTIESRYDYDLLGSKTSPGVPNQLYYDPQIGTGQVVLYNVPNDGTHELHLVVQRQLQDMINTTDNPDIPQEGLQMLKWSLADEISLEQGCNPALCDRIAQRAKQYQDEFANWQQEYVSVYFTPSQRSL